MNTPASKNPIQGLFITGTDTGVGKTVIGASLVCHLYRSGIDVQPRKPVESGCTRVKVNLLPADGLTYQNAVDHTTALDIITPFRFSAALAPSRAARLENKHLSISQLESAVRYQLNPDSICIVEGAGGFYSPIAEDGLNSDLAQALGLPILLVAADHLGCINHVLLTLEAIMRKDLECRAVVLNTVASAVIRNNMDNSAELEKLTGVPIVKTRFTDSFPVDVEPLIELIKKI
ncbi:MAG: dethiobiotin synthase [Gammaproteobacteria bacterium]|nr:dethiobiotin synthase [Gammaproteobacteria bacterium]